MLKIVELSYQETALEVEAMLMHQDLVKPCNSVAMKDKGPSPASVAARRKMRLEASDKNARVVRRSPLWCGQSKTEMDHRVLPQLRQPASELDPGGSLVVPSLCQRARSRTCS